MNTKEKCNIFSSYTQYARYFYSAVVVLLFLFFVIGELVFPNERDAVSSQWEVFDPEWEQIMENGERIPVEIPGRVPAEYGEVVSLVTTVPQDVYTSETICFYTVWQDVDIYIDGELRYSYNTKDSRPFGTNSALRYNFLELREDDAGKELVYKFSSNSKYAGVMRPSYIGDRLGIWSHYMEKSGVRTVISIFLLLMSIFCLIVCGVLKLTYRKTLDLVYLSWTIFSCALWMLSEVEFRQLLFKNVSILSSFTYWSLMLISLPLLLYINEIQKKRYQKIYFWPILYSVTVFVVGTLLQVFDIVQFVQQLPWIHAGTALSICIIIVTIIIDIVKKEISDYLSVGIGILGLLFTSVAEILFYYIETSLSLGTILAVGLTFLLVMAIIKTGQDLLKTEKIRQQAVVAREAQSKFLANMSHEIRTPINAIIGMNEMILRESENEEIYGYAHNIHSASNMLLGLVNDVLDFSKIESGQLELVEDTYRLASVIRDEMLMLQTKSTGSPISTKIDIDENLPSELWGDELRIKQILTNILSNAVKYTEKGSVTLKVSFVQKSADMIDISFAVIDTGIGIKQEDMPGLFDSFKRLELNKNRNIQGTGLGLNIAKQLVDLMKGKLDVESVYGKGSTFTITIPQKVIDKSPIGDLKTILQDVKKKKQLPKNPLLAPDATVLVVDDNSMNLSLMKNLLKRTRMNVDVATSGFDCLELTKKKKYDVIFMDHMMPKMDGVETLHRLRADVSDPNKDSIVIALTANAIAGCREMYLEYGFNDYFSKPIQADMLEELLIKYLPKELVQGAEDAVSDEGTPEVKAVEAAVNEAVAVQDPEISPELLEINYATGLSYCLDSEDFYKEMVSAFCAQAEEYFPALEQTFRDKDWAEYAVIAHGLKGNALNIGAKNFSKLSLQHELAGKEGNEAFIRNEYANYVEVLKKLTEKIKEAQ